MSALARLSIIIDKVNTFIGNLCAIFAFSMVIVVFTVVVLRYGFNIGFIWMQEVYVWLHSFVFMLGAGFTYLANEHVRIDVFYRDASKKYKAIVDLLGNIVLLLPFLYIIWKYSYPFVYRSFLMNEVSREAGGMPALFILKSAILWFCLVLFLQVISNICKSLLILSNSSLRLSSENNKK
tara:strand:+ start:4479 stop:5018 length:540 start_codon:yes stop_codon:yes gene_type:complete